MELPPNCYAFEGNCPCSEDADLTLTFDDDDVPLRAHSCLLAMTSAVLKMAIEECSFGDGCIHLGRDNKNGWVLLLNMIHPISSQIMNRSEIFLCWENRVVLGTLAKKYDIRFVLNQMDDVVVRNLPQITGAYVPPTPDYLNSSYRAGTSSAPWLPTMHPPYLPPINYYYPSCFPHPPNAGPSQPQPFPSFYSLGCAIPLPGSRFQRPSASLICLVEHAAQLELSKTWTHAAEVLIPTMRGEVNRSFGTDKMLGTSGELVKKMLEQLKSNGYEKEALDFAIMFFDKF